MKQVPKRTTLIHGTVEFYICAFDILKALTPFLTLYVLSDSNKYFLVNFLSSISKYY